MRKNKEKFGFYVIPLKIYIIIYVISMICAVLISMIGENDGDVVVGLFFLFFGIFFVSSVVDIIILFIATIYIKKYVRI